MRARWWSSCLTSAADDLAAAPALKVVQKFGTGLRNIDTAACAEKGVKVLTIRRRANISCAEHAFALMLMLARKLETVSGLVTAGADRGGRAASCGRSTGRHTPGGNYPRVGGTRALNGATIGIIGLGEIGREIALRATAFGMRVLYHQRTPRARGRGARTEGDPRAARHAACRKRLDRAAGADRAQHARPDRPRRTGADQARRLHRQRRQRADHQPRRAARGAARRPARRRRARRALSGAGARTTTSCCRLRQRDPDAAHGGLAAPQRPERFRRADHRPRTGVGKHDPYRIDCCWRCCAGSARRRADRTGPTGRCG